jgi:hypothetical protein
MFSLLFFFMRGYNGSTQNLSVCYAGGLWIEYPRSRKELFPLATVSVGLQPEAWPASAREHSSCQTLLRLSRPQYLATPEPEPGLLSPKTRFFDFHQPLVLEVDAFL